MANRDRVPRRRWWVVGAAAFLLHGISLPSSCPAEHGAATAPAALRHWGSCVEQTPDGGFLIVGTVWLRGTHSSDILLLRTNGQGDELWRRRYGGQDVDWGNGLLLTPDGGAVLVGTAWRGKPNRPHITLTKVDAKGNSLWTRTFGGPGREYGHGIQQSFDSGYVVVGYTDPPGSAPKDVRLIRTDPAGNELWRKTYGGEQNDWAYSMCKAGEGFLAAGKTDSFGKEETDVYVGKTDIAGEVLWTKTYGGTGEDIARSVEETREGGFILTGSKWEKGAKHSDLYLVRADADGTVQWEAVFGGEYGDHGHCVIQTMEGDFVAAGNTWPFGTWSASDVLLVRIRADGRAKWTKRFGGAGDDYGYWVRQTADGGFIVVGRSSTSGDGRDQIYLLKTDARGHEMWYKRYR